MPTSIRSSHTWKNSPGSRAAIYGHNIKLLKAVQTWFGAFSMTFGTGITTRSQAMTQSSWIKRIPWSKSREWYLNRKARKTCQKYHQDLQVNSQTAKARWGNTWRLEPSRRNKWVNKPRWSSRVRTNIAGDKVLNKSHVKTWRIADTARDQKQWFLDSVLWAVSGRVSHTFKINGKRGRQQRLSQTHNNLSGNPTRISTQTLSTTNSWMM